MAPVNSSIIFPFLKNREFLWENSVREDDGKKNAANKS